MLESDRDIPYIAKEGMEGILQELEQRIGNEGEEVRTLMGGDCNARTGGEEGRVAIGIGERKEEDGEKRRSKNGKIDREGRRLMGFLEERDWMIFNGGIEGMRGRSSHLRGGEAA